MGIIISQKRSTYKVILIGDPRVGKTSIRKRYLGAGFKENYLVTLGADFAIKRLGADVIQIWDLAGQAVYKSVREGYYKGAEGLVLVFDVTNVDSFTNLPKWLNEVINKTNSIIPMILVGNKADLRDNNSGEHVIQEDASNYAESLANWSGFEVPYFESSALNGLNIEEIFLNLKAEIDNYKASQAGS